MKSQLYKCHDVDEPAFNGSYVAQSPEMAAEYLAEDYSDYYRDLHEILVDVEAEDGTVYTVTVEVQVRPAFQAKKN